MIMKHLRLALRLGFAIALVCAVAVTPASGAKYYQKYYSNVFTIVHNNVNPYTLSNTATGNTAIVTTNQYTVPVTGYYAFMLTGGPGGEGSKASATANGWGGYGGPGGVAMGIVYLTATQVVRVRLGNGGVNATNNSLTGPTGGRSAPNTASAATGTAATAGGFGSGNNNSNGRTVTSAGGGGGGYSAFNVDNNTNWNANSPGLIALAGGGGGGGGSFESGANLYNNWGSEGGGGGIINGSGTGGGYAGQAGNCSAHPVQTAVTNDPTWPAADNHGGGGGGGAGRGANGNTVPAVGNTPAREGGTNGGGYNGTNPTKGGGGGAGYWGGGCGGGGTGNSTPADYRGGAGGGGGSSYVVGTFNGRPILSIPEVNVDGSDLWTTWFQFVMGPAAWNPNGPAIGAAGNFYDKLSNWIEQEPTSLGGSTTGPWYNRLPKDGFVGRPGLASLLGARFYLMYVGDAVNAAFDGVFFDGSTTLTNEGWQLNAVDHLPTYYNRETEPPAE